MRLCSLLFILMLCSCDLQKQKDHDVTATNSSGHYFSIKEFGKYQWSVYNGQPFGIQKIVYMNGATDSIYTNADAVNWGAILKIFFATDISDPKFEGKYDFSEFSDSTTMTDNYYYEAKDSKLFTHKLHIMADARTHKISSIYIETERNSKWGNAIQRLYYEPVRSISIQRYETSTLSKKNEIRIEYKFM